MRVINLNLHTCLTLILKVFKYLLTIIKVNNNNKASGDPTLKMRTHGLKMPYKNMTTLSYLLK